MGEQMKTKRGLQLAIEIGNLSKNGWLNESKDLEFVFREIEKRAVEIMKLSMKADKFRVVKAWAEIGSHGRIFFFAAGPVWAAYGPLMHVWSEKFGKGLVPVKIQIPRQSERGPRRPAARGK